MTNPRFAMAAMCVAVVFAMAMFVAAGPVSAGEGSSQIAHGRDITVAKVGPAAGGFTQLEERQGGQIKDRSAAGRWIDEARSYDGFDVAAGHLLIEGIRFSSPLDISAPFPVVLRGVSVRVADGQHWAILTRPASAATYVLWSEAGGIAADAAGGNVDVGIDLRGSHAVVSHSYISHALDAIHVSGSDTRIETSLINNLTVATGSHNDGIQLLGAPSRVRIIKNRIINRNKQTSCLYLLGHDISVIGNYLAGGGWSVYAGGKNNGHGGAPSSDIRLTDNIFARDVFHNGGHFGPVAYWDKQGAALDAWRQNRFDDETPINP